MLAWMLIHPAADYVSLKRYGFSRLSIVGIAFNILGLTLVLWLMLNSGQPSWCDLRDPSRPGV